MNNLVNPNVRLTESAKEDIKKIWRYTFFVWSRNQANKYVSMLYTMCDLISTNPKLYGKDYSEIGLGVRGWRAKRHIILYRIDGVTIIILRFIHESSDLQMIHL